jgi:hypothetical protein
VPSVPFDVAVDATDVASMDNDGLLGQRAAIPAEAVDTATREIGGILQSYLDAEFVTADTRFSDRPLSALLSQRALDAVSDDDLAGLGALGISAEQVLAEPVTATAHMLTSGSDVALVTVRYDARAHLATADGASVPLHQRATMVFVPEDGTWRAEALDVALDLPLTAGRPR